MKNNIDTTEVAEDIANSYFNGNFTQAREQIKEAFEQGINPTSLLFDQEEGPTNLWKWVAQASLEVLANPNNKKARKAYYDNK